MAKVMIINTGGTLGMVPSAEGLVPNKNLVTDILADAGEFADHALPDYDLHSFEHLIDSSSMNYQYWNDIASLIAKNYQKYVGFLILHGTDTMSYTAAALSFALRNLNKPVVITGSQIPISQVRNDAKDNMLHGLLFAANAEIKEVCIYFGHKLLRGNRSIKYSTDGFAAFISPKYHELAEVGLKIKVHHPYLLQWPSQTLQLQPFKNTAVVVLRLYPNFYAPILEAIAEDQRCQAVVLQVFGKGTMPSEDLQFMQALRALIKSGKPIIVCSHCPQAEIDLLCYQAIRELYDGGAIAAGDMTIESAVVKTQFLLSQHSAAADRLEKNAFAQAFRSDVAGEITIYTQTT